MIIVMIQLSFTSFAIGVPHSKSHLHYIGDIRIVCPTLCLPTARKPAENPMQNVISIAKVINSI